MNQPKAYSYIRFSTPKQKEGDSFRRQIEAAKEYAVQKGLELDESLKDEGLSAYHGTHRRRGALGRFYALVKKHQIAKGSYLIVESFDRLSRQQVFDAFRQFSDVITAGITVVTLQDKMEYSKDSLQTNFIQLIISIVIMSRAYEESLTKSTRLKATLKEKREKIAEDSSIKFTGRCPAWLRIEPPPSELKAKEQKRSGVVSHFETDDNRAAVIKEIFRLTAINKMGAESIAQHLNQTSKWIPGIKRAKNNNQIVVSGWRKSYVRRILANRAVLGEFQPCKIVERITTDEYGDDEEKLERHAEGAVLKGYFPAIISKSLFNRAQRVIENRRETAGNNAGKTGKFNNLFRHLAVCKLCGSSMRFIDKGKGSAQKLMCDNAARGMGCKNRERVRYGDLESLILENCAGLNVSDILPAEEERQTKFASLLKQKSEVEGELFGLEDDIKILKKRLKEAETKGLKRAKDTVLEETEETKVKQEEKENQLKSLQAQINTLEQTSKETNQRIKTIRELLTRRKKATGVERQNLGESINGQLLSLLTKIVIYKDGHPTLHFRDNHRQVLDITSGGNHWEVYPEKYFPEGPP
jgi:hypothetical protein